MLLFLLFSKHFIIDFPLQKPYQYTNKGIYGHPGGILHAALHGLGTLIILSFFVHPLFATFLALLDATVHYHIDWAKVNINNHYKLSPTNSEKYWWLFGLDQYLHSLTYIIIGLCV